MKRFILYIFLFLSVLPLDVLGITPVRIGKLYDRDTSLYESKFFSYKCIPGPYVSKNSAGDYDGSIFMVAYLRKNSKQFDLYTYGGKTGSTIVPLVNEIDNDQIYQIFFSCYMLDEDDGWETMVIYVNEENTSFFKIYDDDGTEILADFGRAFYSSDLNCTYVIREAAFDGTYGYEGWRFRTNLSTDTPKSLSKTKATQSSFMQIYGLSDGNYKVSLTPTMGNQVQFQMFDLMGRCVFSKQLENLKSPVTFTIPESNVPNSPFIAKVKDGNETLYKKQIPVK
jgi:hypothetical protein